MWTYKQSTGEISQQSADAYGATIHGEVIGSGYSGAGPDNNKPLAQSIHDRGPIPQGVYNILPPEDTPKHGPYALPLAPDPGNTMFGRSGFLIHGDSIGHPGNASEGCIILARPIREKIWDSGDHQLTVIA